MISYTPIIFLLLQTTIAQEYFITKYEGSFNNLPSPRVISNTLGQQTKTGNPEGISSLFVYLGQFIDHDISLTPSNKSNPDHIHIHDKNDPMFKWNKDGSIEFFKSEQKLKNLNTNLLDLSQVYGDTQEKLQTLMGEGGMLKMGEDGLIHRDNKGNFICGDIRCNENTILIGFHNLFVFEHNRLVKKIKQRKPHLTDERVFKRARQRNVWQYQKIIFEEWLPLLLGKNRIPKKFVPLISDNYFSTVTFRYGHSMIPEHILFEEEKENLFDHFFQPIRVSNKSILTKYMEGVQKVEQEEFDLQMVESLRNHLFQSMDYRLDLLAINIKRGRDHNLGSYLKYSETYCHKPNSFVCFYKITRNTKLARKLKKLYHSADRIDNFVGILSEPRWKKSLLGRTTTLSILRHFQALASNDPNFYNEEFQGKSLKQLFKKHYNMIGNDVYHV